MLCVFYHSLERERENIEGKRLKGKEEARTYPEELEHWKDRRGEDLPRGEREWDTLLDSLHSWDLVVQNKACSQHEWMNEWG